MSQQTLSSVELVFWNLKSAQPTVAFARAALESYSLNPDRAENVPAATAFRRAAHATVRGKEKLVRFWTRKSDNALCVQIDHENQNGDDKLHREFKAGYQLYKDDANDSHYIDGTTDGLHDFKQAYTNATEVYQGMDVSKIIQEIIMKDGLGTYSPRTNGGVYFVPIAPTAQDLLDRIEKFCAAVGVNFLRFKVPDTGEHRAEVAQAVADSLGQDIDAHAQAIDSYTVDSKLGHLDNRLIALDATASMINKLWTLIPVQAVGLNARINEQKTRLVSLRTQIEQTRQATAPKRRIAGVNASLAVTGI